MRPLSLLISFCLLSCVEIEPEAPPEPYIEVTPATMGLQLQQTQTARATIRNNSYLTNQPALYWYPAGPTYTAVNVSPATGEEVSISGWRIGVDTIRVTARLPDIADGFIIVTVGN